MVFNHHEDGSHGQAPEGTGSEDLRTAGQTFGEIAAYARLLIQESQAGHELEVELPTATNPDEEQKKES